MSGFELLFALLLVVILCGTGTLWALVSALNRRAEAHSRELSELRLQLESGGRTQDGQVADIRDRVAQTQGAFDSLRAALSARQQVDDEARQSLRRLEAIIAGSSTRGAAGENILEEALRHLPPEMIHRNAWVNGKVVEFAMRLPGGKLLPVDSKWTSSQALEQLSAPDLDPTRRQQLAAQVEKEVEKRVREVSQYIDPATTAPFALAAVPDAAYEVCRSAFAEAHRRHVLIVGYSMSMPYLLALYQLHLQFARSVDMDNLQACLMEIDRQLEALDGVFETRLQRATVMLQNAYGEGKGIAARIRATTQSIQASERIAGGPTLLVVEGDDAAEHAHRESTGTAGSPQAINTLLNR